MIQTSYFGSRAPEARKISIAKWPPRWFHGTRAYMLAPTNPKAENWEAAYLHDLETRFPEAFLLKNYLENLERSVREPILCCFEADPRECHRRVLARYVKKLLGWDIPEWRENGEQQGMLL